MRLLRSSMLVAVLIFATSGCSLYGWSYSNSFGEVGDGTTTPRLSPVPAVGPGAWSRVDAGYYHSCGIDVNKGLYCWGNNTRGELGIGTSGDARSTPTRVGSATTWSDVSAGGSSSGQSFTCGVRAGTLLCWGYNANGQLGLGDVANRSVPTPVGTATDWKSVSAGEFNGCAIKISGALYCWGEGGGAIGDGTVAQRLAPVRIGVVSDWTSVSVGFGHTCGLRGTSLSCWGQNRIGQVGTGSMLQLVYTSPQPVALSIPWTRVAAGDYHTCAIGNAALYCWGLNTAGQLGIGTFDPLDPNTLEPPPHPVPLRVGNASDWRAVAAGPSASCGIRTGGLLSCWGNTPNGDGTDASYAQPTKSLLEGWTSISIGVLHKAGLRNQG